MSLNAGQRDALDYVRAHPGCRTAEIGAALGRSFKNACAIVHQLRQLGHLEPVTPETWGRCFPAEEGK